MPPLELLILKTLARGANHGFGVTLHIHQASAGLLSIEEGSLYPALHRLERDGFLLSEWSVTANARKAKFYKLTVSGRKRLAAAEQAWLQTAKGMAKLLRFA